jgi:hypothetical protein
MAFVDLERLFVRIGNDQEPTLEVGRIWGRKYAGWFSWQDLREYRRVVLLAEASSGKSAEFRNQAVGLRAAGHAAFFVTIEELADHGFEAALEPDAAKAFERWRGGTAEAWFFLDSLDEARLNRKSFETALKRFAHALDDSSARARIFISCRVSDWKGAEDRGFIERHLPAWERPQAPEATGDALLDPIFKEKKATRTRSPDVERKPNELVVVQLVPLDLDQCRTLANYLGIQQPDAFIAGIRQNGLEAFAERPGDVIELADYWKAYSRFGSFEDMVEHGIARKLSEADGYRPDNDALSPQRAWEGAERLAGTLTLGKSFTLRAPSHDSEASSGTIAVEPSAALDDWTEAERNALMRRGIFAPATYGRVRFHHRSTQEYLTARWLDRLLRGAGPREEIRGLLFASRYGVDTVVPSLRPASAWLALWHEDIREEIIAREPLILIGYGDPGSLPIEVRSRLLASYATKQAKAEIADDNLENRAIWMFADKRLAGAIREAWNANANLDFRYDILRFIREGAVDACADLARGVALNRNAERYHRLVAIFALKACKDAAALAAVARDLVADAANLTAPLSVEAAKDLYPDYLSLDQLFTLVEQLPPPKQYSGEGFGYAIHELFKAAPDAEQRREFVARLASLCLSEPFARDYQRISARYLELAKHLDPIARSETSSLKGGDPPEYLVRLLMAVERAERDYGGDNAEPPLTELVRAQPRLQRALFWADVAEQRAHGGTHNDPTRYWQVMTWGQSLWAFGEADLPWLYDVLNGHAVEADQRIALSAIIEVLQKLKRLGSEVERLELLIVGHPVLQSDLAAYLAPPPEPSADQRRMEERRVKHERQLAEQEAKDKESWKQFEQSLRQDPEQLRDPEKIKSWKAGAYRLWGLTRWLMRRTEASDEAACAEWRLLEEGFGCSVAEAYRDGLKLHWRYTKPARPTRTGSAMTFKYTNILAYRAIAVEAGEDPDWTARLNDDEAERAALHGCLTDQGYPEWIDALIASHPRIVLPVIRRTVREEYLSNGPGRATFLYRYARGAQALHPAIQKILFSLIVSKDPGSLEKFESMLGMVQRLDLTVPQRKRLFDVAEVRLAAHRTAQNAAAARWYIALLLALDFSKGLFHLEEWLNAGAPAQVQENAEQTFAFLFDSHNPTIPSALTSAPVVDLERLLHLVYSYIRPELDEHHEGSYTPNTRDHAENARNAILGAVLNRTGPDAYYALRRAAADPSTASRARRFNELARGKAERDCELPAWTTKEVLRFERERTAPVKTGAGLLHVVEGVLSDIRFQLAKEDASSRRLLQHANDEDEVQNWLAEQLALRARERYRVFRESEVAQGDKPDLIVASTSASCEVAIEVKHSKNWSLRQLDQALRVQLADDYLKPEARRHGILVITHHLARQWRDTETNEMMTFGALIERLSAVAKMLIRNSVGTIEVKCIGIDATEPKLPAVSQEINP